MRARRPVADRFWEKVDRRGPDECWPWLAATRSGYGFFNTGGRGPVVGAYRVAYELTVGPIPEGLTIDHLCRNRICVNPAHLEPVTLSENVRRKPEQTHCFRGHPYTAETTRISPDGKRVCRVCKRERDRRRYHATKNLRGPNPTCGRGHLFTEENTWIRPDRGTRVCRECARENRQKRRAA